MPAWIVDMIGVFLGAVLGALFGYGTSWYQQRQTGRAQREALFRILSDQLHMIPLGTPEYDPTVVLTRGTVHVSAVDELLQGQTLDARQHSKLIRRLVIWRGFEASHNESVRIFNQAVVSGQIPSGHRSAWHSNLDSALLMLREGRMMILAALPEEYRDPSWKGATEVSDEGILIQHDVSDH